MVFFMKPVAIIFMGPPGSGKGTQVQLAQQKLGFPIIATGQLLRDMREEPSAEGRSIREAQDAGKLVPTHLVSDLVVKKTRELLKKEKGVMFDGSPRTLYEAERLLAALKPLVDRMLVVVLDVPKEKILQRILSRWSCEGCLRSLSGADDPEKACLACGGKIVKRTDDTPEVIEKRWEEFRFRTLPVIEYLDRQGFTVHVDGSLSVPVVADEIERKLSAWLQSP